ncbi:MAG TPA: DoxX family membrane protein [Candidatus Saccharimonadales bacterium]|nr:DoxX family membrane protein [Candidatus Saccharimonadales bacterium]
MKKIYSKNMLVSLLLRSGLATVLIYASISSFVTPSDWIGYLPHFMTNHVSGQLLLHVFSVYEMALAIWLLSGLYLKYAAAIAALTFSGIIFTNLGLLVITFRDITMVFASLALMIIEN